MFIAKQNLIEVFKQIHLLYSNNSEELTKQGCTQFFSGLRYFLAASAFEKRQARAWIDSTNLNDKNVFVDYVGEVVAINDSEYTCNFYNDFKVDEKDYKVGSNFYSAGFVDDSRKNPTVVYEYPSRDKSNIILKAQNGKIAIADAGVSAFTRKYLEKTQYKKALILWLLRNENIESLTKECVESLLLNRYTESVAKALFVSDYSFLTSVNLVAEKAVLKSNELSLVEREAEREEPNTSSPRQQNSSFTPSQVIYYGVPGCGKSKKVQDTIANVEEYNKVRVVFHPEYSSADFIGQIFPCVCEDGHGVDYRFKAGPFSEILRRAYLNPQQQFYLVIEEINRGNAAAIFSDVFQLLDRLKKGYSDSVGGNTYTAGWSQYFVDNADINGYIRKESAFLNEISDENRELIHRGVAPSSDKDSAKCYKSIKITDCNGCEINFTANTAIRLPPNLSIFATMNTSDQNVFTLDNAFKRRFDSELIKNTLAGDEHKVQRETKIEGTGVTWGEFWGKINNLILEKNASMTSTEDKRLGAYFIVGDEKTDAAGNKYREVSKKLFGEKVLEYLWNDAFKFKHKDIFKEDCKSVESLIENFESGGFAAVFKNDEFTVATVQELKASDN